MKSPLIKFTLLFSCLFAFHLSSCSDKTGGAPDQTGDLNSAVQAEANSNLGDGLLKDSESGSRDLCSIEGDAYERFAKLTHQPRDYVFQVAQSSTFHSLYQTRPATYTKEDLSLIQNYFVQADMKTYGSISVEIENSVVRFGAIAGRYGDDPTDANWAKLEHAYAALTRLLQIRETLYAAYTTVFGLKGAVAWVPAFDGAIANLAPIKEFLAKLNQADFATELHLNAYRQDAFRQGITTLSMSAAMRVQDKDYVLHTNFSLEKNTAVVTLRDVENFDSAFEFRPANDATLTAIKTQITAVEAELKDSETRLAASASSGTNLSAEMAEHSRLQAEYNLLIALSYSEARAVVEVTLSANANPTYVEAAPVEHTTELAAEYVPPTYDASYSTRSSYNLSNTAYTANYNDSVRFIWNPQRNATVVPESVPSK